jgi:hypothetical protein
MEPWMAPNDKMMFYKYLDNATYYFEYGCGGSTYQASQRSNIKRITSVESDYEWHVKLIETLKKDNVNFIYCHLDTKPNTWGHPGENSIKADWINYSEQIKNVTQVDLVLIDGRFRVACCLKCFGSGALIAFDDFLDRKHYHIVLDYYDIVEKTADGRMAILKEKAVAPSADLIQMYELVRD